MIKDQEHFDKFKNVTEIRFDGGDEINMGDAVETIEALRDVAIAAENYVAAGYLKPNKKWRQELLSKLGIVPDWLKQQREMDVD